jgi:glucan phosphoethanolaminetransferase (alkaline phosphatase superfamily)
MAVIEAETETGAPRLTTIGSPGKSWVPRRLGGTGLAVFSLLALAPAVLGALLPEFSRQEMLASLAYSLALWSFWLALWGNPWRGCVAASPLLLFAPIAIYLLLAFHAPLSPAAFGVIFETNPQEASEFVGGSWSLIAFAYAALFAIATAALIAMQRDPVAWATRWRVAILLGVPAIFLVVHI